MFMGYGIVFFLLIIFKIIIFRMVFGSQLSAKSFHLALPPHTASHHMADLLQSMTQHNHPRCTFRCNVGAVSFADIF